MQDGILLKFDDYSVYSDNNYNDIINKGETVKLNVSLKNTGSNIARSVKATFSTTSTYISGLSPNTPINYGDIFSGSTVWKDGSYYYYDGYAIQFTVSNSIPNNTQIPINISIVDKNSHTWLSDFNVTVE
ncbi:MAG: hypothetical protein LBQ31_00020 [Bacteroidales bacterium]|nr:hypothetical protein [Bacteroidales bacterium]